MSKNKCKIIYNAHTRTKCMNCIVTVIVTILALVIHLANTFFQEKMKICSKVVFQMTLDEKETEI